MSEYSSMIERNSSVPYFRDFQAFRGTWTTERKKYGHNESHRDSRTQMDHATGEYYRAFTVSTEKGDVTLRIIDSPYYTHYSSWFSPICDAAEHNFNRLRFARDAKIRARIFQTSRVFVRDALTRAYEYHELKNPFHILWKSSKGIPNSEDYGEELGLVISNHELQGVITSPPFYTHPLERRRYLVQQPLSHLKNEPHPPVILVRPVNSRVLTAEWFQGMQQYISQNVPQNVT